jgi:hypothetical protein
VSGLWVTLIALGWFGLLAGTMAWSMDYIDRRPLVLRTAATSILGYLAVMLPASLIALSLVVRVLS